MMDALARTVHTEPLVRSHARTSSALRPLRDPAAAPGPAADWWRGAAIYRIYPRSFQDSNGDGLGDLRGITLRLPYVAALGVDAIWISPFFRSPMHGADIADHCTVDPHLGTLADFDALVAEAHHLGLKVLIDLVPQPGVAVAAFWMQRGADGHCVDGVDFHFRDRQLRGGSVHAERAMPCSLRLLENDCRPRFIHGVLEEFLREPAPAWTCWGLNNHAVARVLTRWQALGRSERLAPLLLALLGSLRGAICIYQGEELGLADDCRTPMPWQVKRVHAGFSTAPPWLPVPEAHHRRAVDVQLQAPRSVLRRYQDFLQWRLRQPALREGHMALLEAHDQVVALERCTRGERILCAFNLSRDEARIAVPAGMTLCKMQGHGFEGRVDGAELVLPPHEAYFGRVERRQMPLG